MKKHAENTPRDAHAPDFEKALARLEKIVEEMEGGDLGLEAMMARFEEGQKLLAFCGTRLRDIEKKIEILTREGDAVVAKPFDPAKLEDEKSEAPQSR